MKLAVFGLGYIGLVTGVCLAVRGNRVIGVDIDEKRVAMINKNKPPFIEKDFQSILKIALEEDIFKAQTDSALAVEWSEIALICVGTPSRANGSLNTKFLEDVCCAIGKALKNKKGKYVVVFRSTITPGTIQETMVPILESASGKKQGKDFFVAFNPEFLREGSAVSDFFSPARIIVGSERPSVAQKVLHIYKQFKAEKIKTSIRVAEMVKYADNCFHAAKITFTNEISHICKRLGLDSREVMKIFLKDKKLNISEAYFRPGFAFGGSCLPKDLRAINYLARMYNVEIPFLDSILESNDTQIIQIIKKIISFKKHKIGIVGFSYKAMVSDIRESPLIEVIETLIGKGYDVKLYDSKLSISKSTYIGDNYFFELVRHLEEYFVGTLDELVKDRGLIIIGSYSEEYKKVLKLSKKNQIIYDLVGITNAKNGKASYDGVCW